MPRFLPESPDPHSLDSDPPARADTPTGVLMVNLGTPDTPTAGAIRRYLGEFLSDRRVIELSPWLWQPILRGAVLTLRPRKLVPRYKEIWLDEGSPLLVYSVALAQAVGKALREAGVDARVEVGMRYGNPSIGSALARLRDQGCERILVLPLYPQYASSTTGTVVDGVASCVARLRNQPELRFVKRYNTDPAYIGALASHVQQFWQKQGKPQRLLLSFHGLPRVTVEQGDPYHRDCMETAQALRQSLGDDGRLVYVTFQSRFGAQRWLEPYTLPTLKAWAGQGVTEVDVMCPGFLADCLETLEEIQVQCRDAFLSSGGTRFRYLPCLNDDASWAGGMAAFVRRQTADWAA
jgi:ferrochelatase